MIYLLSGSNTYKKDQYIRTLKNTYKGYAYYLLQCSDVAQASRKYLDECIYSVSLFDAPKKLIHLKDYVEFTDQPYLEKVLQEMVQNTSTILILNTNDKIRSNAKILKLLQNKDSCFFEAYKREDLLQLITSKMQEISSTSSLQSIAQIILERVDNDPYSLSNEVDKVLLFSKFHTINTETIKEITTPSIQHDIWQFLQKLMQGNRAEAVKLVVSLLDKGENEQAIIAMVLWNVRLLLIVKAGETKSNEQIARDFSYNPYSIRTAKQSSRTVSFQKIITIYEGLARIQLKTKSGLLDPRLGIIVFSALF